MLGKMCISLNRPKEIKNTFAETLQKLKKEVTGRWPLTERPRLRLSCLLFTCLILPWHSRSNKTPGCFVLLLFHLISHIYVVFLWSLNRCLLANTCTVWVFPVRFLSLHPSTLVDNFHLVPMNQDLAAVTVESADTIYGSYSLDSFWAALVCVGCISASWVSF